MTHRQLTEAVKLTGKVAATAVVALIVVAGLKGIAHDPNGSAPNWTDKNRFDTRPRR